MKIEIFDPEMPKIEINLNSEMKMDNDNEHRDDPFSKINRKKIDKEKQKEKEKNNRVAKALIRKEKLEVKMLKKNKKNLIKEKFKNIY